MQSACPRLHMDPVVDSAKNNSADILFIPASQPVFVQSEHRGSHEPTKADRLMLYPLARRMAALTSSIRAACAFVDRIDTEDVSVLLFFGPHVANAGCDCRSRKMHRRRS